MLECRESGSAFVKLLLWTLSPLEDPERGLWWLGTCVGEEGCDIVVVNLALVSFFLFRLWLLGTCILCIIACTPGVFCIYIHEFPFPFK